MGREQRSLRRTASRQQAIDCILACDAKDISILDVQGKAVLTRLDFNVPLTPDGAEVADDSRITAALPTIELLAGRGARVVILSHLGRPEPQKESWDQMASHSSLRPVAKVLARLLGGERFVGMADNCIGPEVKARVDALRPGQVRWADGARGVGHVHHHMPWWGGQSPMARRRRASRASHACMPRQQHAQPAIAPRSRHLLGSCSVHACLHEPSPPPKQP